MAWLLEWQPIWSRLGMTQKEHKLYNYYRSLCFGNGACAPTGKAL